MHAHHHPRFISTTPARRAPCPHARAWLLIQRKRQEHSHTPHGHSWRAHPATAEHAHGNQQCQFARATTLTCTPHTPSMLPWHTKTRYQLTWRAPISTPDLGQSQIPRLATQRCTGCSCRRAPQPWTAMGAAPTHPNAVRQAISSRYYRTLTLRMAHPTPPMLTSLAGWRSSHTITCNHETPPPTNH